MAAKKFSKAPEFLARGLKNQLLEAPASHCRASVSSRENNDSRRCGRRIPDVKSAHL